MTFQDLVKVIDKENMGGPNAIPYARDGWNAALEAAAKLVWKHANGTAFTASYGALMLKEIRDLKEEKAVS